MLLPGTQMHIVTFIFVCIELVIFFYLVIYRLARPDDKTTFLNIILIFLLLCYNITGGLLPDPNLPGSFFVQMAIAYATGFIVPCYFPFYVYKAFGLEKMKFHAFKGVFLFLLLPYILFVLTFAVTNDLNKAKDLLVLPVAYALWVIYTLGKAIRHKYHNTFHSYDSREEITVLLFSLTPWVGLPIIDFLNLGQAVEASVTNTGFLLLLGLHVKRHIRQLREEHQKLIDSEQRLMNWNTSLQKEVAKRTKELERINEQKTTTFVNLAHETKTPLTLINNYLEEYISKNGTSDEMNIIKRNMDKLSHDIINFFDLERFNKGMVVYNHDLVSNFSEILKDALILFREFGKKRKIEIHGKVEDDVYLKADPVAIIRVVNNLIENAIKFSNDDCIIEVVLQTQDDQVFFSVKDCGIGIPPEMHKKVFEPYYQIANLKRNTQGMGLGLPIVKKVVDDLNGEVKLESDPKMGPGTTITVALKKHVLAIGEEVLAINQSKKPLAPMPDVGIKENVYDATKPAILVVEDNTAMVNYLIKKLSECYNVFAALNGNDALKKIKTLPVLPDLIISDVMMDKVDGYTFVRILSNDPSYSHIPFIFLSAKSTRDDKLQGLRLGAIDFIQKPFSFQELAGKISSILAHAGKQKRAVLSSALNALAGPDNTRLRSTTDDFEKNCKLYHLTTREKDIAKLICEGYKYKEIGDTLFISERTVTKHVQNIFEKVDVSNKIELINRLEG
ncbi:response regulator [Paracnuella aquatica]|nr:response regulator [Paracnuella aquatica]